MRVAALCLLLISVLTAANPSTTLYERLGGETGVTTIAASLLDRTAADPVSGRSFKKVNMPRVKHLLYEQLCEATGGPCHYSGDSMRVVHQGLNITDVEFNALVGHLVDILKERGVAQADQDALLAILGPMKSDVVQAAP